MQTSEKIVGTIPVRVNNREFDSSVKKTNVAFGFFIFILIGIHLMKSCRDTEKHGVTIKRKRERWKAYRKAN